MKNSHFGRFAVCFILLVFASGSTAYAAEYFVAMNHPNTSDANDGLSLDQPFETLRRGAQALEPGDTLTIGEGIYREELEIRIDGTEANPVVIRAYPGDEGSVIVRGSDVVSGWSSDGLDVWSVPWEPLPLLDYPSSYPNVDEYTRRREMVFIDGNQLQQVVSEAELIDGSFWMDDGAGHLRIYRTSDPNTEQVEIAVRDRGVFARTRSHIAVIGIVVEHVSTGLWIGAVSLGDHARVEDCRVEYNNGIGIALQSDATVIRTAVSHNGQIGINLAGSNNSLIESSKTNYNSRRYGPGWAAGGIKIVSTGFAANNRIVNHTARFNNGPGVFIDTVSEGNIVESSVFEGNATTEIFFEASIGPNWIINNLILNTDNNEYESPSIRLLVARDTYIYNNTIINEGGAGIQITGFERYSGTYHSYCAGTRVFNNIISVYPGPRAIELGVGGLSSSPENLASHEFDYNLYFGSEPMMWLRGAYSLAEWQAIRGEDLNSISAPPMFNDAASGDYSLGSDSPAIDGGMEIPEVVEDILGEPRPPGFTDIGAYEFNEEQQCEDIVARQSQQLAAAASALHEIEDRLEALLADAEEHQSAIVDMIVAAIDGVSEAD